MDLSILKKKLSTFRTKSGMLTRVSDDILIEVIRNWEQFPGKSSSMAKDLGITNRQLVILVEKAKKRIRDGVVPLEDFKEISFAVPHASVSEASSLIELTWDKGRIIRFPQVQQLVDFLKLAS